MAYNRFQISLWIRVILLSASIFLLFYLIYNSELYTVVYALGGFILYLIHSLYHYVEKTNRELTRFLQSIKHADFSMNFQKQKYQGSFTDLQHAFSDVTNKFLQVRAEKEENFQYLQTVVEHIAVGLIAYKPTGEVELLNRAAKQLLHVPHLRNIQALEKINAGLAGTLFNIRSGEQSLLKLKQNEKIKHISIAVTEFKMKKDLFKLVSLHNIQSEIERERLSREFEIAGQVQQKLLPDRDPRISGYDIATICAPAKEVGGDYYDFIHLSGNKTGIVIGDVSGKGMPASIYMTLTKGILQANLQENFSPAEVLKKCNRLLFQSIERNTFVTLILAYLDYSAGRITFSRAGHNPVIYYDSDKKNISVLCPEGIGLGLDEGMKFSKSIQEVDLELRKNDWLIFYTDGFTEAMNHQEEEYGEEALISLIGNNLNGSAREMIQKVEQDVKRFMGNKNQHDDMTMIAIKVLK